MMMDPRSSYVNRMHLACLATLLEAIGDRQLSDGSKISLKDISVDDMIALTKTSDVYQTGDFKDIDPDMFRPILEKAGVDLLQNMDAAIVSLGASYIKELKPEEYETPDYLRFAFPDASQQGAGTVPDAAQVLNHILCVVADSAHCHPDFCDSKLQIGSADQIRALSLK